MMDRKITLNDYEESNMLPMCDTEDFATLVDILKKDNVNTNLTAVLIKLMRYLRQNNFIVPIADVIYSFRSGEIISEVRNERPVRVEDLEW